MSILADTSPERIYLCISDDEQHYNEPYPEEYPGFDSITWSTDQPVACTVGYVREDIADALRLDLDSWKALADTRDYDKYDAIKTAQDNADEVEKERAKNERLLAVLRRAERFIANVPTDAQLDAAMEGGDCGRAVWTSILVSVKEVAQK